MSNRIVVGVDLGGTKILARAVDPAQPLAEGVEVRVGTPRGGDAIISAIVGMLDDVRDKVRASRGGEVVAIGVGAAGLVDLDGVLRFGPNLPEVVDLDIAGELTRATGLPIVVDNDANGATWGEFRLGAGIGTRTMAMITLGTGIGAGFVADGRLQRGAFGFAGEPGHMRVDPVGPPCPCGRRGCWERFASGSGLARLGREAVDAGRAARIVELAGGDPGAVRGEHVVRAAADGDVDATEVMHQFAWWVAVGLANLVDILDPEIVVVGGGVVGVGEDLLAPVRDAFADLVLGTGHRPAARIEAARLGPAAGAIGVALLAADSLYGAAASKK